MLPRVLLIVYSVLLVDTRIKLSLELVPYVFLVLSLQIMGLLNATLVLLANMQKAVKVRNVFRVKEKIKFLRILELQLV